MVKYKIKNLQTIVCLLFTLFCFSAAIIVLTIGGTFFSEQNPKALNYANSMCQVDSRSYKNYECKSRYYQYTCYGPIWNVHLGEHRDVLAVVETQLRYRSYSDALNEANKYQIGSSYSCWYDTRNPSIAQWEEPSTRTAIILLCFGGLSVLMFALLLFVTVKLIKQEILQSKKDDMRAYLYANSDTEE